jgi:hypothetical protein
MPTAEAILGLIEEFRASREVTPRNRAGRNGVRLSPVTPISLYRYADLVPVYEVKSSGGLV